MHEAKVRSREFILVLPERVAEMVEAGWSYSSTQTLTPCALDGYRVTLYREVEDG